jgi:protein-S-isoprenylcysteine O-methyltransferase Ste14
VTDRARGWVLVSAQFALLGILVVAPTGTAWALPDAARALGVLGRIVGVAAIVLGGFRLGVGASVHPAPTTKAVLRTTGPYRWTRHPIYTGVLVFGAALALTGRSILHVAAWAALLGVLTTKARFEERLLAERFPDYPAYARRTRRFLPFPRAG